MFRAKDLALKTTNDCKGAIAVRSYDTTPTSVVPYAQCLKTLSNLNGRPPRRATVATPTQLRNRNNGVDCKGVPPLHDNLHKVNIKYEYYVRTNIIFSQNYLYRQYCFTDVTHCPLVDIGSRYQPIKSSHDRRTQ